MACATQLETATPPHCLRTRFFDVHQSRRQIRRQHSTGAAQWLSQNIPGRRGPLWLRSSTSCPPERQCESRHLALSPVTCVRETPNTRLPPTSAASFVANRDARWPSSSLWGEAHVARPKLKPPACPRTPRTAA